MKTKAVLGLVVLATLTTNVWANGSRRPAPTTVARYHSEYSCIAEGADLSLGASRWTITGDMSGLTLSPDTQIVSDTVVDGVRTRVIEQNRCYVWSYSTAFSLFGGGGQHTCFQDFSVEFVNHLDGGYVETRVFDGNRYNAYGISTSGAPLYVQRNSYCSPSFAVTVPGRDLVLRCTRRGAPDYAFYSDVTDQNDQVVGQAMMTVTDREAPECNGLSARSMPTYTLPSE